MCEPYNRKRALKSRTNHHVEEPNKRFKLSSYEEEGERDLIISSLSDKNTGSKRKLINRYEKEYLDFTSSGISQKAQLLIRRIVHSKEIPSEMRGQPLFRLLLDVYEKLSLNEIEVTVWSIYLDRFVWADQEFPLRLLLIISAYAAKSYLSDARHFYEYIKSKIPGFEEVYRKWDFKNKGWLEVSGKELNLKYRYLSESVLACNEFRIIEYNYYVDEILQSSPPYRQDLKDLSSGPDDEWDVLNVELESCSTKASNSFSDSFKSTAEYKSAYSSPINPFSNFYNIGYTAMMYNPFIFSPPDPFSYEMMRPRHIQVPTQIFKPVPVRYFNPVETGENLGSNN
ncbi:unnamed protein product [Blepharisma stoltei]|uniref:Cyclin N-terminal domain-containing protein n=1 Tax=Blepharisma stoltei TaxID=1481888 RepID=A0AAU9KDC9_9CILI|nr:unnamed protein product [Blepharisma stoltei]